MVESMDRRVEILRIHQTQMVILMPMNFQISVLIWAHKDLIDAGMLIDALLKILALLKEETEVLHPGRGLP
jgi:hypothetical protein